mmetsp:Transcript_16865/g.14784  ORF Transcript_16865/g.14784 Transcript_16865/m.14784 type:complete len:87 (+) Transcript_16865:388-648(+)
MSNQIEAILLALFIIVPTLILGISVFVLIRERTLLLEIGFLSDVHHERSFDQENIAFEKHNLEKHFQLSSGMIRNNNVTSYTGIQS